MDNIKFNYLYRDASNFKKCGDVIFFNPRGMPLDEVAKAIQNVLWEDSFFIAHQIRIPELFIFAKGDISSDDHCFHEFDGVEVSNQVPTDKYGRTMSEFTAEIIRESRGGWRVFDPLDRLI